MRKHQLGLWPVFFRVRILLGIMICGPLFAQQPMHLSPDEAVDRAIKNNLSLESSRVSTGTKKRASDLSWNQFIPSVTAAGILSMDNEKTQSYGMDVPQWHAAGSIQASLTISIAMFENMNRLRLDYQGGMISFEKAKSQLERDVRKAYNNMVLLQENINLLKENFEAAEGRVAMAQANYRAGLAPELTLLQAQVAMENMKPTIDQVENGFRLSMAQFAMFLGLPYDTIFELTPVEVESEFISLDVKELISKAVSGKPDIQELRYSILLLQSARKAQTFSLLPSLTLSWNTMPAFLGDPWKDDLGNNDLWRDTGALTVTLGLRLHSLLPVSTDFQGIKNLDDQIRTANIGLTQMIQGTEIEIYNTVLSLDRTRITTEAQTQTVNLAERAYNLSEQAYRAGLQDLFQVQNTELELKQAKVSMLEQQFNYLNGLLDLEYSIGVPFGTLSSKEMK